MIWITACVAGGIYLVFELVKIGNGTLGLLGLFIIPISIRGSLMLLGEEAEG